jgi:hypothetical protein
VKLADEATGIRRTPESLRLYRYGRGKAAIRFLENVDLSDTRREQDNMPTNQKRALDYQGPLWISNCLFPQPDQLPTGEDEVRA